ncbi:tetratricopeptide repeat protein [Aeromonas dhakensis]|uniref:tetratricopeptide repeat protein n=1 Tax=Aeromonas dhakensis TaxID=196024 RepID=UPI00358DD0A5
MSENNKNETYNQLIIAAQNNDVSAMFNLALMLEKRSDSDIALSQARIWYEKAALCDHAGSMFNLGLMHHQGRGGDINFAQARAWYAKAISMNHQGAMINLGVMHEHGLGDDINLSEAQILYEQAAKIDSQNTKIAMFNLAYMYEERVVGTHANLSLARVWYEQAANLGSIDAMVNLALMHEEGRGGDKSYPLALKYYIPAAECGHEIALFNLGVLHLYGHGVERNLDKAREFFAKAAEKYSTAWITLTELDYISSHSEYISMVSNSANNSNSIPASVHSQEWASWIKNINNTITSKSPNSPHWLYSYVELLKKKNDISCDNDEVWHLLAVINLLAQWQQSQHLIKTEATLHHFTHFDVLEKLLPSDKKNTGSTRKNILRCYHVSYMNDPSEGLRLIDFHKKKDTNPIAAAAKEASLLLSKWFGDEVSEGYFHQFENATTIADLPASVFTTSFTERADSLDLWRAYGNDGKGISISIPIKGSRDLYLPSQIITRNDDRTLNIKQNHISPLHVLDPTEPRVYRVGYTDEQIIHALTIFSAPLRRLESILSDKELDAQTRKQWSRLAGKNITEALLHILYLFKDEAYASEKEVRAIQVHHLYSSKVLRDERSPRRLFCELPGGILFTRPNTEIIIGPKAEDMNAMIWDARHLLTLHGYDKNVITRKSNVKYR